MFNVYLNNYKNVHYHIKFKFSFFDCFFEGYASLSYA